MTDINFYVSKQEGLENRLNIAYRLVNLAISRGLKIHILTDNIETSKQIDALLWSKEQASFIPHAIVNIESDQNHPELQNQINISHDFEPLHDCDYLINLSNLRPAFFSRFLKVAEILDNNEEILTAGRKRYSFYRDRGYTLEYHKL